MCGIIGYTGSAQAGPILINGLKQLEYRGYDSAGIAVADGHTINAVKAVGKIKELSKKTHSGKALKGTSGIGHTRWATHGVPNEANSHPHFSDDRSVAIVHNGIIENFEELKAELISLGHVFSSDTDSEVIAQYIAELYDGDMVATLKKVAAKLEGSYAVGIMSVDRPGVLFAIKKNNPLVVGFGDGENFIASDVTAALSRTKRFVQLGDGEIAEIAPDGIRFFGSDGPVEKTPYSIDWSVSQAKKGGYKHYMIKEIHEQPRALSDTVGPRVNGSEIKLDDVCFEKSYLDSLTRIDIVGCGSAYHAGIAGKYFIEKHCRIPVNCTLASEYIYSDPITDGRTLTVIISQSGETADTLAALRLAKKCGSRTLAIVNVVHSAIARDADDVLYTHAGPEIAVATTKGYTTQIAVLYLVGLKIAGIRGTIEKAESARILNALTELPQKISAMLTDGQKAEVKALSDLYYKHHCIFFIGRGSDYAAALEGALKLKEISYIHAEAYAAGELKHGTISLIDKRSLTVALITQRDLYHKTLSNIKSVKTRGGTLLAVSSPENSEAGNSATHLLTIPECDDDVSPILTAVKLQLFAYYVALAKKRNIDKPRNLAKSVTVE